MTLCTLLHGAGSTPDFVTRAFGPTLSAHGVTLLAPDVRGLSMPQMAEVLARSGADIVGGVSLGAHAAATYAAQSAFTGGLYAVMPAWCGPPGAIAGLTAHTAEQIQTRGADALLRELGKSAGDDWVYTELRRAWLDADDAEIAHALRVAAAQPAPELDQLAGIRALTQLVALADDPTHPAEIARVWADHIPGARLTVLPRDLDSRGCMALGEPLVGLLDRISGSR